jgi:hypothetical protein
MVNIQNTSFQFVYEYEYTGIVASQTHMYEYIEAYIRSEFW